tara:strand:+ start:105 stop:1277 length:1173 start_codon:yes stop_codon:yes gene_type:complete
MKITVVGLGYVGLSLSVLISQKHEVCALDIDEKKVNLINKKKSPIKDEYIENFLSTKQLNLTSTIDKFKAYHNSDFIIISTPTSFDNTTSEFDTSKVELVIKQSIECNKNATIIIKSTVPMGFTDKMRILHKTSSILFSPEFLREGCALYDNLYPSRIVIGDNSKEAIIFGKLLADCSNKKNDEVGVHYMQSKEAEAVKLFSNTYLAMRIAFFNELDTFAEIKNLSSENIIKAISADNRIGNYYNNPSFGYGGYCLPKDSKQLLTNFQDIPNNLIKSIIDANLTRKQFIAQSILNKNPKTVGIYKLAMKSNSDNFRESATIDIIRLLVSKGVKIFLYEPDMQELKFDNVILLNNLTDFLLKSDLIVANRISDEINASNNIIYTRDIFNEN